MRAPDLDNFPITNPHPRLDPARLAGERRALWTQLPKSYQAFLLRFNGGFLDDAQLQFHTKIPFYKDGRVTRDSQVDAVAEFFGLPAAELDGPGLPGDLAELRRTHDAEKFLPRGIIAIATCPESSLICLSTRKDDFGAVYFWDYYWRYPWSKPFFEPRLQAAEHRFPDLSAIRADPDHPQRQQAEDALNYASLVRLGGDLQEWLETCWLEEPERSVEESVSA